MSPESPTRTGGPAPSPRATVGWLRRRRYPLLVVGALAAAVLALVLASGGALRTTTPLDPDNPDPAGARAAARVLADEGVEVSVVRSADALAAARTGAGTTVLVTRTDLLGRSTARRLLADTRDALLVLAAPGPGPAEALGLAAPTRVALTGARGAGCDDPRYAGLSLHVDHALEYPSERGCFPGEHGSLLAQPREGVVLLGAAEALSNAQILRADNAAAALRLLGSGDRLVWYVPTAEDLVAGDGVSLETLLPRWIRPGLWLGGVAVVALMLWRGRRLGPLSVEPLPVVVRAIETTRSRGRLYRRGGDRAHAAEALRSAARDRVAERLRPGTGRPDPRTVVADVAHHVGRPVAEIHALLGPDAPAPVTDHDLIILAGRLAELDREVRHA